MTSSIAFFFARFDYVDCENMLTSLFLLHSESTFQDIFNSAIYESCFEQS